MLKKDVSAIIGSGYFARVYIKYLLNSKRTQLKYVFYKTNKPTDLIRDNPKIFFTKNIAEILNNKEIDNIFIITPIETHYKLFYKCLSAGFNCLVEKPLLTNKKSISLLEKKFINLSKCVSYPYKFSSALKYIKKNIKLNKIKNILNINITFYQYGKFFKHDIEKILGPHAFTILNEFYHINKVKFKKIILFKNQGINEKVRYDIYLKNKLVANVNLCINYSIGKLRYIEILCKDSLIKWDLKNNISTVKIYKNKRIKYKNYMIGKNVVIYEKKFSEKNNIDKVINHFLTSKNDDLIFTKNLLNFIS